MIVWIQYCVDGTGSIKSKWAVYVAPNHLTLQERFSGIFTSKLFYYFMDYFKTRSTLQVCTFLKVYQLVH